MAPPPETTATVATGTAESHFEGGGDVHRHSEGTPPSQQAFCREQQAVADAVFGLRVAVAGLGETERDTRERGRERKRKRERKRGEKERDMRERHVRDMRETKDI